MRIQAHRQIRFGGQYFGIAIGGGGAVFVYGLWGFDASLIYVSGMLFLSLLFVLFFVWDPEVAREAPARTGAVVRRFICELVAFLRNSIRASCSRGGARRSVCCLLFCQPARWR